MVRYKAMGELNGLEEDHTDPDIFKFKFIERTLPSIGKDVELLNYILLVSI